MDEWNICLALLLLTAIVIPPQKSMGAKGFMNNWDLYIEKPVKKMSPPKLIQVRYRIGKTPINIITYLTFFVDFADWLMCIAMLPCVLLLQDESLDIAIVVFAILYMAINLPIGIVRTICCLKISKKQKVKVDTEEYVAAHSFAETVMRNRSYTHREAMRKHKEYIEIIEPFLKEFERCIDKEKGVRYISDDNLRRVIDVVIPKYQKHLSYSVSSEVSQKRLLTIHLLRNNRVIMQVPIKKFD